MKIQKKQLQLALGEAITYHSKFSPDEKKQLLDFVLEADKYQLMMMFMDGEIIGPPRTQSEKWWIENRFIKDGEKILIERAPTWVKILGASVIFPLFLMYRTLKAGVQDRSRRCGRFSVSGERDACMEQATIWEVNETLKLLSKALSDCSKNSNPDKCRNEVQNAIKKMEQKKSKAESKLHNLLLKGKGVVRGKEIAGRPSIDIPASTGGNM